jgi:hypothetical protein
MNKNLFLIVWEFGKTGEGTWFLVNRWCLVIVSHGEKG